MSPPGGQPVTGQRGGSKALVWVNHEGVSQSLWEQFLTLYHKLGEASCSLICRFPVFFPHSPHLLYNCLHLFVQHLLCTRHALGAVNKKEACPRQGDRQEQILI